MATEKRARKKEHRDAVLAAREAALRRRRNIRLGAAVGVIGVLVGLAMFNSGDDGSNTTAGGEPTPVTTPSEEPTAPPTQAPSDKAACGAKPPKPASPKTDYKKPDQVMEDGVDYGAVIHTSCGDIEMDLLEDETPETVNNFIFLAQEGYYDGLIWHRVEQNSVLQTGDPNGLNGTPPDGPGYTIKDELPEKSKEYVYGVVGMANSGPDSGGSQFFIVIHKNRPAGYQPFYAIFGRVVGTEDGTPNDVLEKLGALPTNASAPPPENVKPIVPAYIESIEITES
jgi:peptidylprolyl isomerase